MGLDKRFRKRIFGRFDKLVKERGTNYATSELKYASAMFQNDIPEYSSEDYIKALEESKSKYIKAVRKDFDMAIEAYEKSIAFVRDA